MRYSLGYGERLEGRVHLHDLNCFCCRWCVYFSSYCHYGHGRCVHHMHWQHHDRQRLTLLAPHGHEQYQHHDHHQHHHHHAQRDLHHCLFYATIFITSIIFTMVSIICIPNIMMLPSSSSSSWRFHSSSPWPYSSLPFSRVNPFNARNDQDYSTANSNVKPCSVVICFWPSSRVGNL